MHDGISLEDFKRVVADFTKEVDTLNERDLENAFTAVGKAYFGIPTDGLSLLMGKSLLEFASRRYNERKTILLYGYNPLDRLKELVGLR